MKTELIKKKELMSNSIVLIEVVHISNSRHGHYPAQKTNVSKAHDSFLFLSVFKS